MRREGIEIQLRVILPVAADRTATCGCNVFPAFVHIHTGLPGHSQQMARGSNVELHSGMGCNESSNMPISNQKRSVRRVFTREEMVP